MRATIVVASLALASLAGCRTTIEGESCTYSGECGGGLICFNGQCNLGNANYTPTGKVCVSDQCRVDNDCNGNLKCSAGKCICTVDADCGGGMKCSVGKCMQCVQDTDCTGVDRVCNSGLCRAKCVDNFDCQDFYSCNAGHCTFVGCTKDRECAISVGDVRAKCDTTLKNCYVPCTGDVECDGSLTHGSWFGMVCSKNRCENVGCDTAADCQLFLPTGTSGQCVIPTPLP